MKNGKIQVFIALSMFVVPLLAYVYFRTFTKQVYTPVLKMYEVSAAGDTNYYKLPNFTLTDQDGNRFTQENMKGNIYLVSFFPPIQDSILRVITAVANGNIKKEFYDNADKADFIKVLSISNSPTTQALLQSYPTKLKVDSKKWTFATGDKATVWNLAKNSFHLPEFEGKDTTAQAFAVPNVVLVDKNGFVRGYWDKYDKRNRGCYEATQLGINGMKTLSEDLLALLISEYKVQKP